MKKLMTLLSAAAVAFGLQAADTGTSFEGMEAGDLDITSSTGELVAESSGYWRTNGNEQVSLKVVQGVSVPRSSYDAYPSQYEESSQLKYLEIKTPFGNAVERQIKYNGDTQEFTNGFYFDSLVKFTAFDEDPLTTAVTNDFAGAKIAVWLQEVKSEQDPDVVVGTNLYVRAGYLGGQGDPTVKTYDCGSLSNADAWHRLTIKAIPSIYALSEVPGFVVFIDGIARGATPASYDTGIVYESLSDKYEGFYVLKALFPSCVQSGSGYDTLKSISFDGQGEVDDIVFTETVPFEAAKDSEFVYVSWNEDDVTAVSIDGEAQTVSNEVAKLTYTGSMSPVISVTYAEGKLAGTWTGTATIEGESVTFNAAGQTCEIVAADAAATFQGTPYATLADAIDAAEEASASLPPPVLKLYNTSSSDDIDIAAQTLIVLDLNGQELGKIDSTGALRIIDSVGGGIVTGEVNLGDGSIIDAGTFDEMVTLVDDSVINGGRFDKDLNEGSIEEFAAEGYEFVEGTGDDEGYLVLVEKAPEFAFEVTAGNNSYVSEVLIDNVDVTEAVTNGTLEVITSNLAWSVTFTANAGYQFEAGVTTTNFTGTAEAAVAVVGPAASEIPATPSFTVTPGSNSTVTEVLVNGNDVTADVPATLIEGDTWSVTFTADTDYAFDGGATTTNFTGTAAKVAIVVEGPAAAKQQGGWVDPGTIPENTDAGTQYPELADSDLAETDAKKLTVWAEANNVEISVVAAAEAGDVIFDSYLLGCEPTAAAVAEAKEDFVPSISIVDGEVIVTAPEGEFNGTLKKYGSADLETWTEANTNEGYNFFKYELVP